MAVQEQFPTNMHAFDDVQAFKDVMNSSVTHSIDSFVNEMASNEWDLSKAKNLDSSVDITADTVTVLPQTMTSSLNKARPTHSRKVTIDETSPAVFISATAEGMTLTADDWRIGAEQLIDIEPTPVSELMKQDPVPLLVQVPPPSASASAPCPPPLTLPEDLPVNMDAPVPPVANPPVRGLAFTPPVGPSTIAKPVVSPHHVTATVSAPIPATAVYKCPVPRKPVKAKRARRKKEPDVVQYIREPTDIDCVLGRGGKSNHHPGNKRYRAEVQNLQQWYKASNKSEKTDLSQHLVNFVHSYGGRFVKQEKGTDRWYVVSNLVARRKASQALREHMSMEERLAKKAAIMAAAGRASN